VTVTDSPKQKLIALEKLLRAYGKVAIGFSGGVDSTFLAAVCQRIMPTDTLLVHLTTPLIGTPEQASFREAVDGEGEHAFNLPFLNLCIDQLELPEVATNDPDRCYHCKRAGFTAIVNHARKLGFKTVIDGSNASDVGDYRPGMRAAKELGVKSPLMEVGFTKDEERELLRAWGYTVWNMPAGACLATRIPTGEALTRKKVDLVRAAEDYMHNLGANQIRARLISGKLVVEAAPEDLPQLADESSRALSPAVAEHLRTLGFNDIDPTVHAYGKGNMNA
jgi:pyridinium-3,5-biscarboxylic acid mononucleotide sulfurtransferase